MRRNCSTLSCFECTLYLACCLVSFVCWGAHKECVDWQVVSSSPQPDASPATVPPPAPAHRYRTRRNPNPSVGTSVKQTSHGESSQTTDCDDSTADATELQREDMDTSEVGLTCECRCYSGAKRLRSQDDSLWSEWEGMCELLARQTQRWFGETWTSIRCEHSPL